LAAPRRPRKQRRVQPAVKILTSLKESLAQAEPRKPTADEIALWRRIDERWNQIERIAPGLSKGSVRSYAWLLAMWEPFTRKRVDPNLLLRGKRAQLDKLMAAMHRTSAAINELERKEPFAIVFFGLDNLREPLEQYRDAVERALTYVPAGKSGASPRIRIDREIKDKAAGMSHRLLKGIGIAPDRSIRGPWIELTEILFEIATNREAGDVSHACEAYEKEYERMIKDPRAYLKAKYGRWPLSKRKEQHRDS
jgi:hypothetical protein